MQKIDITLLAKISLLVVLYILLYYTYFAFINKTIEGDSAAYHIPIAKVILHGAVLNPEKYLPHFYSMIYAPGASELIVSFIMLIGLPINLSNVFGLLALLFASWYLANTFELRKPYAILFAATICTLHTMVRWLTSQTVDLWLAVFFILTLALLQRPEKKISYFLKLGFSTGMLIGTKYTGPLFFLVLCFFYSIPVIKKLNLQRIIAFLIPFSIFGLFWYVRNILLKGDPYYPQSIPLFKGVPFHMLDIPPWKIMLFYKGGFTGTLTAFFSEYTIWAFALPVSIFFLLFAFKKIRTEYTLEAKLILIGLINFMIYVFLPDGPYYNLYVSTFRYSYPGMIPIILSIFILAKQFKREHALSIIAVINMVMLSELNYYPKLLFFFLPIGLLLFYVDFNKTVRKNFGHLKKLPAQLFYQKK